MTFASILLAGGQNKRMNQYPKWNLMMNEETMLQRSIRHLKDYSEEIIIVTGGEYQFSRVEEYHSTPIRVVYDPTPFLGPLNGIRTGLKESRHQYHFVVAADMPFFSLEFAKYMVEQSEKNGVDIVIPRWNERLQPLHGVYTQSLLDSMSKDLSEGKNSLVKWIMEQENKMIIDGKIVANYNRNQRMFFNMNHPEDYQQALVWIKEEHCEKENTKGN
ncbi:molybdenum cofactor guanylyltransferase [Tepidibacillus marianensis]|uniref:molybdenum cofactor guanylyltransferase n=1 Tax=Tepidibacillus marianensis TaxID=3131995 RepID=UPI0030D5BB09